MRFTGVVLAVLVANIVTIGLVFGAYAFLKSDQGQILLYDLGLQSLFLTSVGSNVKEANYKQPKQEFTQPRLLDMQPMSVTPGPSRSAPSASPTREKPEAKPEAVISQAAIRSSLKMCRFWSAEYKKDRSSQSKAYRDQACKRYERFSGQDSTKLVSLAGAATQTSRASYENRRAREERERMARHEAAEQRKNDEYCERIRKRISHYDSLLRAGGSAHYMNRLRNERREVSLEYSRKCLLGQ